MAKKPNTISLKKYQAGKPTPLARAWYAMRNRCLSKFSKDRHRYGERGITICDRWLYGDGERCGFTCFAADMGEKPSAEHTLDREDNNGNYEPGNCRWATRTEQVNNYSRNRLITLDGETLNVTQWARRTGLTVGCIDSRFRYGWDAERAIKTPRRPAKKAPKRSANPRKSHIVTIDGVSKPLVQWARERGLSCNTARTRIRRGWSGEDAIRGRS